jgi:hypothetical protein
LLTTAEKGVAVAPLSGHLTGESVHSRGSGKMRHLACPWFCDYSGMDAADRIIVSFADEQLFVEVWLVVDEEFRQDLTRYEEELIQRQPLDQPATVRMQEWSVQADTGGTKLSIMHQMSGGGGTASLMEWILWPLQGPHVNVTVRHRGETVWSVQGLRPPANTDKHPLPREILQHLRPMPDKN